jgi:hypothetical protein
VNRALVAGNVAAIALVIAYGAYEYGAPAIAARIWREDYKKLMFRCDHVMREHFIAKLAVESQPSEKTVKNLEAAELGLLDCHDYDKLRKRMLTWNVSADQLSQIGLEAMEEKQYELRDFVKTHEIKY